MTPVLHPLPLYGGTQKALCPSHTEAPLCALLQAMSRSSPHLPHHDCPSNPGGPACCCLVYPPLHPPHTLTRVHTLWTRRTTERHAHQSPVQALTAQKGENGDGRRSCLTGAVPCAGPGQCGAVPALLPPSSQMWSPLLPSCSRLWTQARPFPRVPINHPATGCCFSKLPPSCLHLG